MTESELHAIIERLRAEPREAEWLEFKANRYDPQEVGEYLSALVNLNMIDTQGGSQTRAVPVAKVPAGVSIANKLTGSKNELGKSCFSLR